MAKPSTLTPSQAAAVLAVSATTLRRWSKDFGEHLSESARGAETDRGGHHRSYTPNDIATLQRAAGLLREGHSPEHVSKVLAIADDTQALATLATLPTVAAELRALRDALMQLRGDVAALQAARQADQAELETMRASFQQFAARQVKRSKHQQAEIDDLRARIDDLQARRSWWNRLRGR